jgi:hypothetical protein
MNCSAIKGNALEICTHRQQAQTRVSFHLDLAGIVSPKAGPRLMVGFKYLPDAETASFSPADGMETDSRCSCHAGHVPTRPGNWDRLRFVL